MTEAEFNKVVAYVYMGKENVPATISYSSYKESQKGKKKAEGISKEVQEAFEEFWKEFPGISRFEYKGRKFPGERVLKANKQVCLKLYNDAIQEMWKGKLSELDVLWAIKNILKALKVQVANIMIESYKCGLNRMQYMKSCEVYLRQKAYEPWLGEEMPVEMQEKKVLQNSTDM